MKKILILLMALSLFTACNNDNRKGSNEKKADYREKDDYRDNKEQSDDKSRKHEDLEHSDYTSNDGWSERDISKYNVECMSGFGNNQDFGKKICPCALEKFQKKYKSYSEVEKKSSEAEGKMIGAQCKEELKLAEKKNSNNNEEDDNERSSYPEKDWPAFERRDYVASCVREAVKSGINKYDAQSYCECMQIKMEKRFPDIKVADRLSQEELVSISKKNASGCLEEH